MEKLTKAQRAEIRRKEIMEAAKKCMAEKGFHAASVDMIAKTAGINVGQLYRYFANKEAIIEAIAQCVFVTGTKSMYETGGFTFLFEENNMVNAKIMSEIHSEANRNPTINAIMIKAENKMRNAISDFIRKKNPSLAEKELLHVEMILRVVSSGIFMTMLRNKEVTPKVAIELSNEMLSKLLPFVKFS